MNENTTKARIKSKTGIDCVIAWFEPRDEKVTRVCKERLGDLYKALKKHLEEF